MSDVVPANKGNRVPLLLGRGKSERDRSRILHGLPAFRSQRRESDGLYARTSNVASQMVFTLFQDILAYAIPITPNPALIATCSSGIGSQLPCTSLDARRYSYDSFRGTYTILLLVYWQRKGIRSYDKSLATNL